MSMSYATKQAKKAARKARKAAKKAATKEPERPTADMSTYRKPARPDWLTEGLVETLERACQAPIDAFRRLKAATTVQETPDGPFIHIDRGASVLAVAHLDTVQSAKPQWLSPWIINTPDLDDRLGVWILLSLLPRLHPDVKYDVLLCDSEEVGESTAKDYAKAIGTDHAYNWLIEFDRKGVDVVTYDYDADGWDETLAAEGLTIGSGAFSDISYLEALGVKGVNFGCGYYRAHSKDCWADLRETRLQVDRFADFWRQYSGVRFPHVERDVRGFYGRGWSGPYQSRSYNAHRSEVTTYHKRPEPTIHTDEDDIGETASIVWDDDDESYERVEHSVVYCCYCYSESWAGDDQCLNCGAMLDDYDWMTEAECAAALAEYKQ